MPFHKDPMSHGNLIIEFEVKMPERGDLNKEQISKLINILPGKVNPRPEGDKYEMLEEWDQS